MADQQALDPARDNQGQASASGQDVGSILTGGDEASQGSAQSAKSPAPETPAWMAQLEGDLKKDASLTKFKTLSDLGKSYRELEGKLGKAVVLPGDGASEEEVAAFYKKVGRPDSPDQYVLDDTSPELKSLELDKAFRTWAHEAGLSQSQAAALYGKYNAKMAELSAEMAAKRAEGEKFARAASEEALRKEWGPGYDENLKAMRRAFQRYGSAALSKWFDASGAGNNPEIVKLFSRIGRELAEAPLITSNQYETKKTAAEVLYPNVK